MNVQERVEVEKKKNWFPLQSVLSCESLVSVKENTNQRRKKNMDTAQTKVNSPHVRYNVSEKKFRQKIVGSSF